MERNNIFAFKISVNFMVMIKFCHKKTQMFWDLSLLKKPRVVNEENYAA